MQAYQSTCDNCGCLFMCRKGKRGRGPHQFCSYRCNYTYASKRRSERVVWPHSRICIVCGTEYTPRPQAAAIQRFCSPACRVNYCRYREWAALSKPLTQIKAAIKEKR